MAKDITSLKELKALPDEELVRRSQKEDEVAFGELVSRYET